MAELRGSRYAKDGIWWVKFLLPPGQSWTDPKSGVNHSKIETSVRRWYGKATTDGKGDSGYDWAGKLLAELNAKYYEGVSLSPQDRRTTVRDLMNNLIATYRERGKNTVKWAEEKLRIFSRHDLASKFASDIDTSLLRGYAQNRMKLDGVKSPTVNHDFKMLRKAFREGLNHKPRLVTEVPSFPFGECSKPRKEHLNLEEYDEGYRIAPDDFRCFYVLGCSTGVRIGALLETRWSWIEFFDAPRNGVYGLIRFPYWVMKNGKPLVTFILDRLYHELQRLLEFRHQHFPKEDRVFVRWNSKRIKSNGTGTYVGPDRRAEYLCVIKDYSNRRMKRAVAANRLDLSTRMIDVLVARYRAGGDNAIMSGPLTGKFQPKPDVPDTIQDVTPMTYTVAASRWKKLMNQLGRPELHPHDMRRTAREMFARNGIDKSMRKTLMGHLTDSMDDWYRIDSTEDDVIKAGQQIANAPKSERPSKRIHAVA